jgi:hypothetical protein
LLERRVDPSEDFLAAVRLVAEEQVWDLEVRVYDRRALLLESLAADPFQPPSPAIATRRVQLSNLAAGQELRIPGVGYGRKRVEVVARVEREGQRVNCQAAFDAFVHEGLGSGALPLELEPQQSSACRLQSAEGESLSGVLVEVYGSAWGNQRRVLSGADGRLELLEGDRWLRVWNAGEDGQRWAWAGPLKAGQRQRLLPGAARVCFAELPAQATALAVRGRLASGTWLPLASWIADGAGYVQLPSEVQALEARLTDSAGQQRFTRLELSSEGELSSLSPWQLAATGGHQSEDFYLAAGCWPPFWIDGAAQRLQALGERRPLAQARSQSDPDVSNGPEVPWGWATDGSLGLCLPPASGTLTLAADGLLTRLPVYTFRAHDSVEVRDELGNPVALGFTDRYAEWFLRSRLRGPVLIRAHTWRGPPANASGAWLGLDESVGLDDLAFESNGSQERVLGFLLDSAGEPLSGVPLLAQWYPAPGRFAHRQATSNAHGFFALAGLPSGEPVDLLLRDPAAEAGAPRRHIARASRRILPGPGLRRPLRFVIPAGSLVLELAPEAVESAEFLELHRLDPASELEPGADTLVLSRRVQAEHTNAEILGLTAGQYEVRLVADEDREVWRGAAEVGPVQASKHSSERAVLEAAAERISPVAEPLER